MEQIRAWFDEQARSGRKPCRNLHLYAGGMFLCEPFRLVSTGSERPTVHPETFEAAVSLIRGRGANAAARCENRFAPDELDPSLGSLTPTRAILDAQGSARGLGLPLSDSNSLAQTGAWHDASKAAGPEMEPRFVTYEDARKYLGLRSVRAVQSLVYAGKLLAVGATSGRRVTMASLLEYAAALEEQAANGARGQ